MDRWTEIELFAQVAELGSLSRAAEALGLSNAAASRHLAALEERLSARLVQRNARRLHLTDVGDAFYRRCKPLLAELRDAESAVNDAAIKPTGVLRVMASLSFSMIVIAPLLTEFNERYPDLRIEIVVSNRYPDLIESRNVFYQIVDHLGDAGNKRFLDKVCRWVIKHPRAEVPVWHDHQNLI